MTQILLVEDHHNQRLLYESELSDEGYDVVSAANGLDGLELFKRHKPAVVIIDVLLPGINGIELMERMLSINPEVAIIIHSAYSSPSHDFVTWFAYSYVLKSGDLTELKNQVRSAVTAPVARMAEKQTVS